MNEQWEELKETIVELRDNDGTGTQQEVCKFLVNYMDILEKQMQEPCGDLISRQSAIFLASDLKQDLPDDEHLADMVMAHNEGILEYQTQLSLLPPVNSQEPKTGHWIYDYVAADGHRVYHCSECGCYLKPKHSEPLNSFKWCSLCGAKMVEPQKSEKRSGEEV